MSMSEKKSMTPWIQELHSPNLVIPVTVDRTFPVNPAGKFPGDALYLSNLDNMIGARVFTPTVYFFPFNPSKTLEFQTLCNALSTVLVPYYPFSGRLRDAGDGKLEVFFGAERGALMVEARSEMAMADLGALAAPNLAWSPLIFRFPEEEPYKLLDMPLLIAQVTRFRCGGFSLGLRICHCLCDGLGAMQFIRAWSETARSGELIANPIPVWDREFFKPRNPPSVDFPHHEFKPIEDRSNLAASLSKGNLVQKCFRIGTDFQFRLKTAARSDSSFDSIAGQVWRSWARALEVGPAEADLRLTFSVNARGMMRTPALRDGFYGNAVCVACAMTSAGALARGPLQEAARRVREARRLVSEAYVRSTVDYAEVARPTRMEFGGKLTVTQWTRFSLYGCADFGLGRPVYAGPVDLTPTPQVCVLLPEPGSEGGVVVCLCLPESSVNRFMEFLGSVEPDEDKI